MQNLWLFLAPVDFSLLFKFPVELSRALRTFLLLIWLISFWFDHRYWTGVWPIVDRVWVVLIFFVFNDFYWVIYRVCHTSFLFPYLLVYILTNLRYWDLFFRFYHRNCIFSSFKMKLFLFCERKGPLISFWWWLFCFICWLWRAIARGLRVGDRF